MRELLGERNPCGDDRMLLCGVNGQVRRIAGKGYRKTLFLVKTCFPLVVIVNSVHFLLFTNMVAERVDEDTPDDFEGSPTPEDAPSAVGDYGRMEA